MKIVVGSTNIPKTMAVEGSFNRAFPNDEIYVTGVSTESGVSSHPTSAQESIAGALNRLAQAKNHMPGADYYVGIEGGLLQVDHRMWEIGWVAIGNALGQIATGLSAGVELRGAILDAIINGEELDHVLEEKFDIHAAGNANGFYGLATNDLVTRQAAYEQGITFALAQFLHPEFYKG